MQAISQLRAAANLLSEKELLILVPELVWLICGTETAVVHGEKRTLYRPAHSLVPILTELSPLVIPTIFMCKCLLMTVGDLK